jgi:hypothetical protein
MAEIATRGDGILGGANGRITSTYPSIVTLHANFHIFKLMYFFFLSTGLNTRYLSIYDNFLTHSF